MLSQQELRAAIRAALEELAGDIAPSPRLTEYVSALSHDVTLDRASRFGRDAAFRREAAGRQWRRRSRPWDGHGARRRLLVVLPATAAATAVAAVLLASTATAPSFAVTKGPDDSIRVTVRDLAGVSGANQRLREYGAPIRVVPIQAGCTSQMDLTYLSVTRRPISVSLGLNTIEPGYTAVIAAEITGSNTAEMAIGRVTGAVPSCVAPVPQGYQIPTDQSAGQGSGQDSEENADG